MQNASMAHCWDLPSSSFGGGYARFMGDRHFHADERTPVRLAKGSVHSYIFLPCLKFVDNEELAHQR